MSNKQELAAKLDEQIEQCFITENYEKIEEISREICQLKGLDMAEDMPDDFLLQIKKKERKDMHFIKLISKNLTKIAAVFTVALAAGGIASAALYYNSGVNGFKYGLTTGEVDTETESEFSEVTLPENSEEVTVVAEQEKGEGSHAWNKKKIWEETSTLYSSDDKIDWKNEKVVDRYTQYSYDSYYAAAEDNNYEKVFGTDYVGNVDYQMVEHLNQDADPDYSISGKFRFGNGTFTLEQTKEQVENTNFTLITNQVIDEYEYVSSSGYAYKLVDDKIKGKTRTSVVIPCEKYRLVLTFTEMSEDEIHEVLENIKIAELADLSK